MTAEILKASSYEPRKLRLLHADKKWFMSPQERLENQRQKSLQAKQATLLYPTDQSNRSLCLSRYTHGVTCDFSEGPKPASEKPHSQQAGSMWLWQPKGHKGHIFHLADVHLLWPAQHMSLGARDAQIQDPLLFLQYLKKAKLSGRQISACVCLCV